MMNLKIEEKIEELLEYYNVIEIRKVLNITDDISINEISKYYEKEINAFFNEHIRNYSEIIEIETLYNSNISNMILIDTPDGYQEIGDFYKKSKRECFKILTSNKLSIKCSFDHLLEKRLGWEKTENLNIGDAIYTKDGWSEIKEIKKLKDSEVYDFEVLHENHRYWGGDGISSHNTGKTLLALTAALEQSNKYASIMLARPIVPLANRDIGFLPGDVNEKIAPYMQPLFDNLGVIKYNFSKGSNELRQIEELQKNDKLIITPLAYIRGRSLANTYFIIDEAQNLTPHEVKTIITRAGQGAKFVFTGDIFQIDSPYLDKHSNGLTYLIHKLKGQPMFTHINLLKGERSPLAEMATNLL